MSSAYEGQMRVSHLSGLFEGNVHSMEAALGLRGNIPAPPQHPETLEKYQRTLDGLKGVQEQLEFFVAASGIEDPYNTFVQVPFQGPYSPMMRDLIALDVSTLQVVGSKNLEPVVDAEVVLA